MRPSAACARRRFPPRPLTLVACATAVLFAASPGRAQFPISESFQNANGGSWTVLGTATFTSGNADPAGQGWLRLTAGNQYEIGNAVYDTAFSSAASIVVSFVYASHGGSAPGADGFACYLIDGSTAMPTQGGDGGSLGYSAQYASCTGAAKVAGVANGWVGIGFDEYGDFSDCLWGRGGPVQLPDAVAIRGSGSRFDPSGFQYLTGAQISAAPLFQRISTASRIDARPVRIWIVNGVVTVEMDFGSGYQAVIDRYDLATAPGQAALPATFKLGFSASTGWFTNLHEIRNLLVVAPATLTLSHVATPSTVSVGETVTYTVTVGNDDMNSVNGIGLSDTVPPGITGVTWTAVTTGGATLASASGSGNVITDTLDLPKRSSVTFTITGTATAAAAGTTLEHAATITPPSSIANLGNVSAIASVAVRRMATAVSVGSSPGASTFGAPITFTAAVSAVAPGSGTPTGSVTFMSGTSALGTSPLSGGVATFATSSLPVGTDAITAVYGGDASFLGATSPVLAQVVDRGTPGVALDTSPSSPAFGEPLTFTATVTGAGAVPTGIVTFRDGGATLGATTVSGGIAMLGVPWLAIGTHAITASYEGDSQFLPFETVAQLDVARSGLCLVQADCLGDQVCVKDTRRGEFGLCQTPSSTAASLGCSTTGGGASAVLLALVAFSFAGRRRPSTKR